MAHITAFAQVIKPAMSHARWFGLEQRLSIQPQHHLELSAGRFLMSYDATFLIPHSAVFCLKVRPSLWRSQVISHITWLAQRRPCSCSTPHRAPRPRTHWLRFFPDTGLGLGIPAVWNYSFSLSIMEANLKMNKASDEGSLWRSYIKKKT